MNRWKPAHPLHRHTIISTLQFHLQLTDFLKYMEYYITLGTEQITNYKTLFILFLIKNDVIEEFEDTKGVIRIRKSKKDRQHISKKKKYKRTNNDLLNIIHKTIHYT
jgi:hypothetical protein